VERDTSAQLARDSAQLQGQLEEAVAQLGAARQDAASASKQVRWVARLTGGDGCLGACLVTPCHAASMSGVLRCHPGIVGGLCSACPVQFSACCAAPHSALTVHLLTPPPPGLGALQADLLRTEMAHATAARDALEARVQEVSSRWVARHCLGGEE